MKRRIIGMLLVVVMLTLSLASCGYSLKDDDMSKYAAFSEENKEAFLKALEKIIIEDGDFTTDADKRKDKVLDYIYQNTMTAIADADDKKTEGVPGLRDKMYYFYYVTADFDGTTAFFEVSNMKSASANIVLGLSDYDDEVKAAIASGFKGLDITDKVHTIDSSANTVAKEGDVAYVSYTYSYKVDKDGVQTDETKQVVNKKVVIAAPPAEGAAASTIESYFAGKKVATSLDKVTIGENSYTDIKIDWISSTDTPAFTFTNVTYTEEKLLDDTNSEERNLKDKLLTYYIFPSYYLVIPEYNTANLIDLGFGENLKVDTLYSLILGEDYANLDEKEDKAKIEERANLIKDLKTADGDTIDAFAEKLVKLYKDITDAETAKENAAEELKDAEQAVEDTKSKLNEESAKAEPDASKITALQEQLVKDNENLAKATESDQKAKEAYDTKKTEKDNYIKSFLAVTKGEETFDTIIERSYRELTYKSLQKTYNETIRMNLAKEVYYFITKNVTVSDKLPEKAVDMTYNSIMENYEYDFYEGTTSSDSSTTNYKKYKTFKAFFIAAVSEDYKTVTTYEDAKKAVRDAAEEYVKPLVQIYRIAEAFNLTVTDKEFKEYKKNPDNEFDYTSYSYGENSVLHAYQLDKILDYFVAFEETEPVKDANGYEFIQYKFTYEKMNEYVFGTPASEADNGTATE